jgi:hypothetical protein
MLKYFSKCFTISFILAFILFCYVFPISYSLASEDRQVVFDEDDDNLFIDSRVNNGSYLAPDAADDSIDIESVNFFSDGKTLDIILWIGDQIPSNNTLTSSNVNFLIYGMLIDSDFDPFTGKDGIDYQLEIQWNNQTKSWTKFFGEYSSTNSFRTIETQNNYSNFYGNAFNSLSKIDEHGYVTLSLDLEDINSPKKYNIMFYSQKWYNNDVIEFDFSNSIALPSPEFSFTLIETNEIIRQGDTKTISTQFKTNLGSLLKNIEFESIQNESGIKLTPKIKELTEPFFTTQPVVFDLTIDDSIEVGQYTIPILLKINVEAQRQAAKFLNLQYYIPSFYNSSGYILADSNVTISVIPKLTGIELFKEFWNTFGDFTSLIGGGFIAGITALVFERIKNKKNKG